MLKNTIKWYYKELKGLFTNKNTFHLDKFGFLEYLNIENYNNFSRIRRGGSSQAINVYNIGTDNTKYPNIAYDFYYIDNESSTGKLKLMLAGQRALYYVDKGSSNLTFITLPTLPSGTNDNIFRRWSFITLNNRLIICTGILSSIKNAQSISIDNNNKRRINFPSGVPTGTKPNDVLFINGSYQIIKKIIDANKVEIKDELITTPSSSISSWRVIFNRGINLMYYDVNDKRTKSRTWDNYIYKLGALAPPTQITYDTNIYYDQTTTYGWIYRGRPNSSSTISVVTGSKQIKIGNANDITALVQEGHFIYVDDVEYEIDSVSYESSTQYLTINLKSPFKEATIDNFSMSTSSNYKGNGLSHWWAIYYGKLKNINGAYLYSYAYYNSHSGHISNLAPIVQIREPYKGYNIAITNWNYLGDNDPEYYDEYDTIIFFRSRDGGVLLYEVGRVPSNQSPVSYSTYFYDKILDVDLKENVGEKYYNSPPPSFLRIEEYQGRIWGIDAIHRNKLYYSMDEVQIRARSNLGRAEECFPPTNYVCIPPEDGEITGLKKAGDYLYVATGSNLYIVKGYNELTYGLEKIMSGYGIYQEAMCEYSGFLTKSPGLFFVSKTKQAFIISPDGIIEVGKPIEDLLAKIGNYAELYVNKINTSRNDTKTIYNTNDYKSNKARNYIIVNFKDISGNIKNYIYDIDMNEWYEHSFGYQSQYYFSPIFYSTKLWDIPVAIGAFVKSGLTYDFYLNALYNDNQVNDLTYSFQASLKTSWLDFDNRSLLKSPYLVKLFSSISNGWTINLYKDEETTATSLKSNSLIYQEYPYQEGKELSVSILDTNASLISGHLFSFKINYPNANLNENIDNMEFLFTIVGQVKDER